MSKLVFVHSSNKYLISYPLAHVIELLGVTFALFIKRILCQIVSLRSGKVRIHVRDNISENLITQGSHRKRAVKNSDQSFLVTVGMYNNSDARVTTLL